MTKLSAFSFQCNIAKTQVPEKIHQIFQNLTKLKFKANRCWIGKNFSAVHKTWIVALYDAARNP